jgi:hypothetical protein
VPKRLHNQRWKVEAGRLKREAAEARALTRASRTVAQQLAILANRPGESRKERSRLGAKAPA